MKHLFSIMLLFSLTVSASADSNEVRVQTCDKMIHIGSLLCRVSGSVIFQAADAPAPMRIPDEQIAFVQFSVKEDDDEQIQRLFDEGEYRQVAELLNGVLLPFEPYVALPSNLTQKFMRWMAVSYWTGDYKRVESLAAELSLFSNEELIHNIRFYRGLTQLETGDIQTLENFLKTPEAAVIYPDGSAVRLYIEARLLQKEKKYKQSIRTAALLIAMHGNDADWMPRAELLCAKLYFQLERPESAQAVLADINEVYSDPQVQKKAATLAAEMNGENR